MKHIPERMCVGCRKMKDKSELIKIVRDKSDGEIKIDVSQKLFGRGAYICHDKECLKISVKKKGFERIFKTQMTHIYEQIGKMIE